MSERANVLIVGGGIIGSSVAWALAARGVDDVHVVDLDLSGLYAVTPDRSGIADAVAGFSNLYEAHSFTGRGVMQSFAIGRATAALVATGGFEDLDLSPLSRTRFADPARWVTEELHI